MAKLLAMVISFAIGSFLVRITSALGIAIFTYKGLKALINNLLSHLQPLFASLPSAILDILAIAGVPEALSIIGSAVLTRAAINSARAFVGVVA